METKAGRLPHTLFWIAGIAVTVFSVVGIAAVMGWIPTSIGGSSESVVARQPATTGTGGSHTPPAASVIA